MSEIFITKRFKSDLKKAKKNTKQDVGKLLEAIEMLANSGCLPEEYLSHPLIGNWKSKWECHVQPDFLLIYEVSEKILRIERCGSHADLF